MSEYPQISAALKAELMATAHALADAAREVILPQFRQSRIETDNKAAGGDFDPVTVADRAAERVMREILAERRPEDAIHGEEEGRTPGTSGFTWVLDPIDGTRAFISGMPTWGVLIGVNAGQAPVFGIVDQPYIGERFEGGFGSALLRRGAQSTPLATRACGGLEEATLFSTFPEIGTQAEREAFGSVRDQVRLTRYGADCYGYALVALGQVDLVIEAGLNAYDIQGPQAVIEAAGGIVTAWDGGPADQGGRILAAGDPKVHRAAMALLAGIGDG